MRDLKKIEDELRFAADAGCDYTLLLEAADAIAEARTMIDALSNGYTQKTVYVKMITWANEKEMKAIEENLNKRSPDRIVLLPTCVEVMNPEELEIVKTKILGE